MEENNDMEVQFEPATEHISVRITTTEKKMFIKWCRENRLTKSQGIRRLITDRLATPEQIQQATDDLTDEIQELKRAISEIKEKIGSKPEPKPISWEDTLEKVLQEKNEKSDDTNTIYVTRDRLERRILTKREIAVLANISIKTLGDINRYKYESGEPVYPKVGEIGTRGLYDCSKVSNETYPIQYKVDIDWSRLLPK